ncbi:unnamed protein product [Caenorhabditis sp. 36 PRJEB53466]|nr:unnamed protein product [Caenorhabditis sp. 36 PRJEB53466]
MGSNQSRNHPRFDTCTWDTFIENIREINRSYRSLLVENGEYLTFALRREAMERGPYEGWQREIEIICCKVNVKSKSVRTIKTLTFREFSSAYDLQKVMLTKMESHATADPMTTTQFIMTQTSDVEGNCIICMENLNDTLLPCLHSFCIRCIIAEHEYRTDFSCPICKTKCAKPIESSWEVPDVPDQEEVKSYLKEIGGGSTFS